MADHFSPAKEIIFRISTAVHLEIGRAVIVTAAKPESNHLFLSQQIRNRLTGIPIIPVDNQRLGHGGKLVKGADNIAKRFKIVKVIFINIQNHSNIR